VAWRVKSIYRGMRRWIWRLEDRLVWPAGDATARLGDRLQDEPEAESPLGRECWRRYWPDLLLAAVLAFVAVLSRRHGLPTDGLWQDDAEPGAAVMKSPLSQLLVVGKDHPGYIAVLKAWRELVDGSSNSLAGPAFIAGILSPSLLYAGLRSLRFERSVSFLLGAALAAAQTDIVNSGRVRSFTTDLLIVLGLAVVLPRLARIKWNWGTAVAWFVGAMLVGSFSGFALGATLAAGGILLLHRRSDLWPRLVAVGAQVAASAALYAAEAHNYSSAKIEDYYRELWDAFPDFHANPISFAGELLLHLRRLADAFPATAGPTWLALAAGLIAVAGIVIACLSRQRAIAAQFLALVLLATVVGSLFGKVPFGPKESSALDNGYRVSLWLVPVIAVGLAMVLHLVRRPFARGRALGIVFDLVVFAAAAVILISAGPALRYPFPGAKSAATYIQTNLGPNDAVILPFHTEWSFAAESRFPVKIVSSPETTESFDPVGWSDPRIHYIGLDMNSADVAAAVSGANRVFVYYPALQTGGLVPPESQTRTELTSMLRSLGLSLQHTVSYQDANTAVDVFGRGNAPSPAPPAQPVDLGRVNLQQSDFPPGWSLTPPALSPAKRLLSCLGVAPAGGSPDSVVTAKGPGENNVVSELDRWQGASGPRGAATTLARLAGAACVRSTVEATFASGGLKVSADIHRARAPRAAGRGAVAYTTVARVEPAGSSLASGSIVFAPQGRTSALVLGFHPGQRPFPASLMSDLLSALSRRINAAP
jgi:hypothetical protein